MKAFDLFIRRPVLATVISLLILVVGFQALMRLPIRQYPEMSNTVITVTTTYPGANSDLIQGFVTQPIQKAVSTSKGLDYLTSSSSQGVSTVKAFVRLNEDPDAAMTEVTAKVNEVRSLLPRNVDNPVISKETGETFPAAFIAFSSKSHSQEQITDYVNRVIQPKLAAVSGVSNPEVFGAKNFSIRVWLDPEKMAQQGLTASDVQTALTANNFSSAAGSIKGSLDIINTKAETDLTDIAEFRKLVVRNDGARLIRLQDIGEVSLAAESSDMSVFASGQAAIFVGVFTTPEANPLSVIAEIRETALPAIIDQLPEGMTALMAYDSTVFITESIREVVKTIVEAAIIVMVVIFLFMGSVRSVVIPLVTVPLSLVGVAILLMVLGFSINLLTLLAMVLAIGLVVDDAIVVVENVHRHIEEGSTPFQAAIDGTREIALPVISMTITLAAVYAPIAFMGGLTGALFREFALALAGSVVVSGVVALTLSPMMCSKILRHEVTKKGFAAKLDSLFERLQGRYGRLLDASLADRPTTVVFALIVMGSLYFLFSAIPSELAPDEDQGAVLTAFNGPASASNDYMNVFVHQIDDALRAYPETEHTFLIAGIGTPNSGFGGASLKPWAERERDAKALIGAVQTTMNGIAGVKASVFSPAALPGADGLPVQFVISSTTPYEAISDIQDEMMKRAQASGRFIFTDTDLKFESPQTVVSVDRDKAAAYGITMDQIGGALATMTGGNYVNLVNIQGRSYKVIPQVPDSARMDPDSLGRFYIRTHSGTAIPLSSLVTLERRVLPQSLNQFNQLNAFTISGFPMPGVTLGQALAVLEQSAAEVLPSGYTIDYAGQSRQFIQEGSSLIGTFVFALIIIFLVLAAQFESFRDPLVIMISVPLSICGALLPLALGATTMNIYTQVGLVTLIGLITKHGILMCEVARERQEEQGLTRAQAIEVAAKLRLRPILMTTAAMVAGLIPLMFASGAGANSRFSIAVVIVAGMSIGTLFTLFVLPVIYTFLAEDRSKGRDGSSGAEGGVSLSKAAE
ncbi:efflux RND transporter permease subunit [Rhodospirillum rubrum]|uniref:Acriflavin resistance protein n=1 Tax=Rhodospirillum rubrum (strain ATCC 11170 / ATH 1.1.1 / DSM 467 / LMG 4362 / NCIMB 8255 / S1) TaxID=269796 RepID=Q2RN02_RHORT|nr:efflux RND transporter permease subunit [Rhodospirillum rubrum]ABC24493.1 Acriflavin resistance protein [Rhodospirillum rubrum ATCC 11170]AEO50244.1 acriflavin resistance protein [Rhodospirillum rubrum F11]MBK5956219.1 multidrug efflux protein [Rhodospirillum rubrum]QXG80410.1 efflux RND transporter permease subunit [Rhodospirillum rubrum]HAQ00956.1 multidrug efflux protein [Rhodospirillum rubrum]